MCTRRNCCCNACSCIGIIISILLATIVGVLFAFGLIPAIVVSAWIAFGIGVFVLIVLIAGLYLAAVNPRSALSKCLCQNAICMLIGSIGTIVTALAGLSILLIICIPVIVLVAVGAFFLSLLLQSLICFIICLVKKMCSVCE